MFFFKKKKWGDSSAGHQGEGQSAESIQGLRGLNIWGNAGSRTDESHVQVRACNEES